MNEDAGLGELQMQLQPMIEIGPGGFACATKGGVCNAQQKNLDKAGH